MLGEAGCPAGIVHAYFDDVDHIAIRNTLPGGGLGRPHQRPRSIPQGGPLSMVLATFLLHPWAKMIRKTEVGGVAAVPRALADDMIVTAKGPSAARVVDEAGRQQGHHIG